MEKRRSPNYPAVSFPEAMQMARAIYAKAQRHKTEKENLARILGYQGLNGKSLRLLGTLNAHGLLAGTKAEMGVTEMGETAIVDPSGSDSRYEALVECAYKPSIYRELMDKYEWNPPSDEIIRSYVLKSGYSTAAAESIIRNFRDTVEFIEGEGAIQGRSLPARNLETTMPLDVQPSQPGTAPARYVSPPPVVATGERELFSYDFEPAGSLRLLVSAEVATEEAMEVLQELLEMKRREVKRKAQKSAGEQRTAPMEPESTAED